MYALTRLQAEAGTWYWAVHLKRRGDLHYRRFYDPMFGGSAGAKAAAIAWRDEQLATVPTLSKVEFCQRVRENNTSGVPGVHFLRSERQPMGIWQAKIKLAGKARHKSFSVKMHGYEAAYEMAVAARLQMLLAAEDEPYLYSRVAINASKQA